ncbi:MAG TPA: sensor domain-containing diguanylate cyclase [Longimicrobiales bacterium]
MSVSEALRGAIVAGGAAYLGALVLLPWLPPFALAIAAVVALAAIGYGWNRAGRPWTAAPVAALGLPLHLLLLATGGLDSPLLPLVAPWLMFVALHGAPTWTAALSGLAALLLVAAEAWYGNVTGRGILEAGVVTLGGLLPAWRIERTRRVAAAQETTLNRILDEVETGHDGDEAVEAVRRLNELESVLDRIRIEVAATRAVLWDVDGEGGRAWPRVTAGGADPAAVPLAGDPLCWAWEEAMPLRLETPPRWAAGAARTCVIPLEPLGERASLLTFDFDEAIAFPSAQMLADASRRLWLVLRVQQREARAVAARQRLMLLLGVLRQLPRELAAESFAKELADAATQLADGTGAAVALWEDDAGRVLAASGDDGGPEAGAGFGPIECEMALAARHGVSLIRDRRRADAHRLPVAVPGERWLVEPRALGVVPLRDAIYGVTGVLAVWTSEQDRIDPRAVEMLETLAPYAALQLRQHRIFGSLRESAERDPLTGLYNRRVFDERLSTETKYFQRHRRPVAMVLADIDHFKQVNDTHGHEAGDSVLRAVAALLRSTVREVDLAARFGGEELVVLLPETPLSGAQQLAERFRRAVESTPIAWNEHVIPVRVSLGVSAAPECAADPSALLATADAALYAAKRGGRNRVAVAPPVTVDRGPDLA